MVPLKASPEIKKWNKPRTWSEDFSSSLPDTVSVVHLSLSSEESEVVSTPRLLMSVLISLERLLTASKKTLLRILELLLITWVTT